MAKKGQTFINYSVEFKLFAVNKYLEGEMAYTAIAKELGLFDHSYIRRWVKNYREFGVEGLNERGGKSRFPLKGRPSMNSLSLEEAKKSPPFNVGLRLQRDGKGVFFCMGLSYILLWRSRNGRDSCGKAS
ncbi:transposase [Bacillus smithii]|uniref:transposase n=1 Tax=Bacillus smithii TaxID=1479 RepID=UPI0030C934E2